jgi:hypothetical protein
MAIPSDGDPLDPGLEILLGLLGVREVNLGLAAQALEVGQLPSRNELSIRIEESS